MRRLLASLLLLLASTACSLPLSHDVSTVRAVEAQPRKSGDIQVLPPGPKPTDTPSEVVVGFRGAQANAERRHAIARQFLTAQEAAAWRDDSEVQVYDPDREVEPHVIPGGTAARTVVEVSSTVTGEIAGDGSYSARAAARVTERYVLEKVKGEWRLADVPNGLRLTPADRDRAYQPTSVYYLALAVGDTPPHLVPDQVFLPRGGDAARTLVTRLLLGPSGAVAQSVTSAFPAGTRLRRVAVSGAGLVTVDLDSSLARQRTAALEALSAQLVWTLRGLGPSFTGLRLLQKGLPVKVPTVGAVQDASDWASFDPEGLGPTPPYFFLAGRRLRSSSPLASGPATAGGPTDPGAIAVDAAAVTPDRTQVALLTGRPTGPVTITTGPLRGPFTTGPRGQGLASPSWGSGQYGLWLLQSGRQVVLLRNGSRELQTVTVLGLPAGRLQALAMSRDGARAGLVVGGQVWVGRVEVVDGLPRIAGLTMVLPDLSRARALAWASGIELVVIGRLARDDQVVRLAVDGSTATPLNSTGVLDKPESVAASSAGVLVGSGTGIYLAGRGFSRVQTGTVPVYPG
ncbi:MAG: Lipoprotein LpqB, beta-propeller domain-like protein [Frankiales bacterium]|nr:Lipoprotein LpqB, beta-propeller domain-like protein [Frankiales bacterium]